MDLEFLSFKTACQRYDRLLKANTLPGDKETLTVRSGLECGLVVYLIIVRRGPMFKPSSASSSCTLLSSSASSSSVGGAQSSLENGSKGFDDTHVTRTLGSLPILARYCISASRPSQCCS